MTPAELDQPQQKAPFSILSNFRRDPAIGVSRFRFYLLRGFYGLIVIGLAPDVWGEIFTHTTQWEPLPGIAFSFWAAFSALCILGIFHPMKMLPLILIQLFYKSIWLIIVAYPLWSTDQLIGSSAQALTRINLGAVIVDLFIIPWPYVVRNYILGPKKT